MKASTANFSTTHELLAPLYKKSCINAQQLGKHQRRRRREKCWLTKIRRSTYREFHQVFFQRSDYFLQLVLSCRGKLWLKQRGAVLLDLMRYSFWSFAATFCSCKYICYIKTRVRGIYIWN